MKIVVSCLVGKKKNLEMYIVLTYVYKGMPVHVRVWVCECVFNYKKQCFLVYLNLHEIVYSQFQPSCLTLNTLFGITSMKPKVDYYPFFALMLRWEWPNLLWPGTVWFGIFFGIDLPESTGGDATAAAAAPAAPGAELMSGKKC